MTPDPNDAAEAAIAAIVQERSHPSTAVELEAAGYSAKEISSPSFMVASKLMDDLHVALTEPGAEAEANPETEVKGEPGSGLELKLVPETPGEEAGELVEVERGAEAEAPYLVLAATGVSEEEAAAAAANVQAIIERGNLARRELAGGAGKVMDAAPLEPEPEPEPEPEEGVGPFEFYQAVEDLVYDGPPEVVAMFKELDADGSGTLDITGETVPRHSAARPPRLLPSWRQLSIMCCASHVLGMPCLEVRTLAHKLGRFLTRKELDLAMKEMDEDKSGEVEFGEFRDWWAEQKTSKSSMLDNPDPRVIAMTSWMFRRGFSDFTKAFAEEGIDSMNAFYEMKPKELRELGLVAVGMPRKEFEKLVRPKHCGGQDTPNCPLLFSSCPLHAQR